MLYMARYNRNQPRFRRYKKKKDDNKIVTKKSLRRVLNRNIESKQHLGQWADQSPISTTVGTQRTIMSPIVGPPSSASQGVGDLNRIGAKIMVKSILVSFTLMITTGNFADVVRIMLVRDKNTNGTQITTSELLSDIGTGNAVTSPIRASLKDQFEIYYDRVFNLKYLGPAVTVAPTPVRTIKFTKYFKKGLPVTYYSNANTGTIADVQENNVSLLAFSAYNQSAQFDTYTSVIFQDA